MTTMKTLLLAGAFALGACTTLEKDITLANAQSIEAPPDGGYAYPPLSGSETIETIVQDVVPPPYQARVQMASSILEVASLRPYPPTHVPIIEGDNSDILVLMSSSDFAVTTVYQARALVAVVSSSMRNNPLFVEYGVQNDANLFDMLKIMGFSRLIVTDGVSFSYAFDIE